MSSYISSTANDIYNSNDRQWQKTSNTLTETQANELYLKKKKHKALKHLRMLLLMELQMCAN